MTTETKMQSGNQTLIWIAVAIVVLALVYILM